MSFLFALLLALASPQTSDRPQTSDLLREVVRRAQANFQRNNELAEHYNYKERQVRRHLDAQGKVTRTEIATYDVIYIAGTPWKRLISRDDRPLSADEQRREQ